jgi:hypothetical protein
MPDSSDPVSSDASPRGLTRRRMLLLLGWAGVGLALEPDLKPVRTFFSSADVQKWIPPSEVLRQPWVALEPAPALPGQDDYLNFLHSVEVRHVPLPKVIWAHAKTRQGVANALPPRRLWSNLLKPLQVVDALAERLGTDKVQVISAYRTRAYNSKCPGAARDSQHVYNRALDIVFDVPAKKVAAAARELRDEGFFRGGIGEYARFTHIDARGSNVDWRG